MFNSVCIYVTATSTRSTTPSQIKLPFSCSASPPLFAVSALALSRAGSWRSSLLRRVHWSVSELVSWLWWDLKWLVLIFLQQLLICRKKKLENWAVAQSDKIWKEYSEQGKDTKQNAFQAFCFGHGMNKVWKQPCPNKELCGCIIWPTITFHGSTWSMLKLEICPDRPCWHI